MEGVALEVKAEEILPFPYTLVTVIWTLQGQEKDTEVTGKQLSK